MTTFSETFSMAYSREPYAIALGGEGLQIFTRYTSSPDFFDTLFAILFEPILVKVSINSIHFIVVTFRHGKHKLGDQFDDQSRVWTQIIEE